MPPVKASQVRSYHRLAANGGGDMDRGTTSSPELAKEKKKKQKHIKGEALPNKIKGREKKTTNRVGLANGHGGVPTEGDAMAQKRKEEEEET